MRNPPKDVTAGMIQSCATQEELNKLLGQQEITSNDNENNKGEGISE